MSSNSAQSFIIDICNGPPMENNLHNMCLHPLSRTHFYVMYPTPAEPSFFLTKRGFIKAIISGLLRLLFRGVITGFYVLASDFSR